jgi:hypothetical protein
MPALRLRSGQAPAGIQKKVKRESKKKVALAALLIGGLNLVHLTKDGRPWIK